MLKKRILLLTLSLVLAFTILTGQIAGVAYADNGNHGKKQTEEKKEDKQEKYLKPQLNVKVKNGSIIVTNKLINPNGRKTEIDVSNVSYTIKIEPFYKTKSSRTWTMTSLISAKSVVSSKLKPGKIKEMQYEDILNLSTGLWNKEKGTKYAVPSGKYLAQVDWTVNKGKKDSYTMSVSKVFTVNQKGKDAPEPNKPQVPVEKPNVYVDLKTTKQDGRLRLDFALVNESTKDVTYKFNDGQQFDIVVIKNNTEIYRWSDGMGFIMALTEIDVPAEGKYQFPPVYWDYLNKSKNKVDPGYYTVKVEVVPDNLKALNNDFDIEVYDSEEIRVDNTDVRYSVDVVMQTEVVDRQLKLNLTLRNRTNQDVVIWQQSSEKYRLTIKDKKGNIVYHSDADQVFAAVMSETKLYAGQTKQFAYDSKDLLKLDLEPGEYTAEVDLRVGYVLNANGSIVPDCNFAASSPIKLTEFDVNKNVAVTINPRISDGKLYIPISLTNVSGNDQRVYFGSDIDYTVVIKIGNVEIYKESRNLYAPNKSFDLKHKETIRIDELNWNRLLGSSLMSGEITIQVIVNGDVFGVTDRAEDWQTVQRFTLPK